MHQNLRTTFYLKNQVIGKRADTNETFEEGLRRMQMLIPSMNYGTFFCISADISGETVNGKFVPDSCNLFLQNYQGDVTIGLVGVEEEIDIAFDEVLGQPVYLLKVHLKALHAKTSFNRPQSLKIKEKPTFDFYQNKEDWDHLETKNGTIDSDILLRVLLIYDDLDSDIFNPNGNVNSARFIDSNKYERDGDELFVKDFKITKEDFNVKQVTKNMKISKWGNESWKIISNLGVIRTSKCKPEYVQFRI